MEYQSARQLVSAETQIECSTVFKLSTKLSNCSATSRKESCVTPDGETNYHQTTRQIEYQIVELQYNDIDV